MASQQEWADWLRHPVTEAVIKHLEERKSTLIEELLNTDIASKSTELLGLNHLAYRSKLDGLGEFLDLEGLAESIVRASNED